MIGLFSVRHSRTVCVYKQARGTEKSRSGHPYVPCKAAETIWFRAKSAGDREGRALRCGPFCLFNMPGRWADWLRRGLAAHAHVPWRGRGALPL